MDILFQIPLIQEVAIIAFFSWLLSPKSDKKPQKSGEKEV